MPRANLAAVARRAGVAVSTVSRVLNHAPNTFPISPATQERVRSAASVLGYVPSAAGRLLRQGKSRTIGVLSAAPDTYLNVGQSGFMAEIFTGIMRTAIQRKYNVSLLTGWNAPVTGLEQIRHLDLVDGLLVVNRDLSRDTGCSAWVRSWPKPVVFALDYPSYDTGLYFVTPDDEAGGVLAVEQLLAAGHRTVGFAKGRSWAGIFGRRQAGWARGLRKAGIVPRPEWVLIDPGEPDAVQNAGVTALLAANEPIARSVVDGAAKAGLRVPEDLSVAAFGHLDSSGGVHPHYERFAMVVHPLAKTVEAAVELLLDRIDEGKRDRRVIRVPYTWREGPSVASCPTAPSDNTDRSDVRTRIATPTLTYRDCFPRIERT